MNNNECVQPLSVSGVTACIICVSVVCVCALQSVTETVLHL